MDQVAEPERPAVFFEAVRVLGALLLGALLIAVASNDIPAPIPWLFGFMPLGVLWLTRRVGLLLGLLAATATLGAVYAAGVQEPSQLFFVAVLAGSGLCLAACARRGVPASTTLVLAVAPVLLVAAGYLLTGGLDELSRLLTGQIEAIRQLESERRVSQMLGLIGIHVSSADFERGLTEAGKVRIFLLPSLFALKWILVLAINCWLASVLFQDRDGFPAFAEFSTWRVHAVGAWVSAVALALVATMLSPAFEAGVNLAFPLAIAYTIQGFAVLRFLAIAYEVRPAVQIASMILVGVAWMLMLPLVLGIGFFDAWFDFRRRAVQGSFGPWGERGDDE